MTADDLATDVARSSTDMTFTLMDTDHVIIIPYFI